MEMQTTCMVPVQYAVIDKKEGKIIQCHPHTESGERKIDGLIRILQVGYPPNRFLKITLYMKGNLNA